MSVITLSIVALVSKDAGGSTVTHYFSDRDYVGPLALPDAGGFMDGRLEGSGVMRHDMYGPGRTMGEFPISSGAIVLGNADGQLDYLKDYAFDGQRFSVYQTTATMGGVSRSGYIEQPTFEEETVTFQVRDVQHALDVTMLTTKYAGTNSLPAGVEGTAADIKGQPKPLLIGTCRNVAPVCVNTSKQIYQFDGRRGFVTGYTISLYDKRSVLTAGSVYTSQSDIENNAPTAGQYRVYPAGGMVRTNASHSLLTGDVFNPHTTNGSDDIDDVLFSLFSLSPGGISVFGPYLAANPGCGIYVQDDRTALSVVREVAQSCQVFFTAGRTPVTGAGTNAADVWGSQLCDPASMPYTPELPIVDLSYKGPDFDGLDNIKDLKSIAPSEGTRGLPVWRVNLKFAKNYRVMSATDLAGVALSELATWSQEYLTVVAEDASVKTQWPNAPELTVVTLLTDATEAAAEATRLLNLFKVQRQMFTLTVPGTEAPSLSSGGPREYWQIGARVRITYPRYGLDNGKLFLIVGIQENTEDDTYDLTVWG